MSTAIEGITHPPAPTWTDRLRKPFEAALTGDGLKAKVFRGGAWLGAGSSLEQVIRFVRNMILTRLLAPEAFGTMAIVLSASSVVQTIMDVGVKEALIQNPRGHEDDYVGAAWWMAFGRAATFWAVLSLSAPFIARFYGNHLLSPLFRVVAIGVLFEGAISSRAYLAIKSMKFRNWATINHGGAIAGVLITLALSFFLRNVWALVLGYCAESIGRFTLSYVICPFLPPRRLPLVAIRDLLRFSKKAFGLSLLNLIFARTDIFVLAKMVGPAELGLYTMAIYLVQTPTSFLMNLLGQTMLPAFSRVQDNRARISRILIQVTSVLVIVGIPALVFTFFCGHSLLRILYGARYSAASGPLMMASCVAFLNLLNGQITSIFYAKGLPQLHRRCVIIMAITMIALIYPFVARFGLVGGQLAALLAIVAGLAFQVVRVRALVELDALEYGKLFLVSACVSIGIAALYAIAQRSTFGARPVPGILAGIVACILAYCISGGILLRSGLKWRG
jgi:O-antigen/teichoic acid export membrane protein